MKKYLIILLALIMMPCISVNASGGGAGSNFGSEVDPNKPLIPIDNRNEKDDIGHVIEGFYSSRSIVDYNHGYHHKVTLSNGSGIYLVRENGGYIVYSVDGSKISYEYYRDYYIDNEIHDPFTQYGSYSSGESMAYWYIHDFYCTIPIFDSSDSDFEENVQKYKDDGDTSGCENYDDVNVKYEDEFDDSIPLPHNFRVIQGTDQTAVKYPAVSNASSVGITQFNKDIVVAWEQADVIEGLQYEIEYSYTSRTLKSLDNLDQFEDYTSSYQNCVELTSYGSSTSMTVQISKDKLNSLREKGYLRKLVIRLRNCKDHKTSNWVNVTIDLVNKTATASEEGFEDNSNIGGDEYDNTNVDYDSSNSGNNSVNVDGSASYNEIMQYIRDGFGLLGNGGIIALMAQTFLFLPNVIWRMIKFFVAMIIVVAFIKLIKDVLL